VSFALIFSASLFISLILVPLFIRYASSLGLVDQPDGLRKIHTKMIPRSGGLAIGIAALLPLIGFTQLNSLDIYHLLAALVILCFGVMDDRFDLKVKWKFLGQIVASLFFLFCLSASIKFPLGILLPNWIALGYLGIFLFVLATTNAVNLADGLDGLAGGTVMLSLVVVSYLAWSVQFEAVALVALAIAGALFGFLRYNTHPAVVFMGDTGSQFIGFMLATLAVLLTQNENNAYSPLLPLFLIGLPLIDTVMVMSIRIREKRSPFSPDKKHLHHQLLSFGFKHHQSVAIIYLGHIAFLSSGFFLRFANDSILLSVYIFLASLILISLALAHKFQWKFESLPNQTSGSPIEPSHSTFLELLSPYASVITLFIFWQALIFSEHGLSSLLAWAAIGAMLIYFLYKLKHAHSNTLSLRLLSYCTCLITIYPHLGEPVTPFVNIAAIFFTASTAFLFLITLTILPRQRFKLDNQDILLLVILIFASFIPLSKVQELASIRLFILMIVMFYAIEFLLNQTKNIHVILRNGCLLSLFIIALNL
jgi:UDP-GlcNAc:undecaprenyl-phosphate/decaprenyl-phosphate GlcNAc-1-phosphate transferase